MARTRDPADAVRWGRDPDAFEAFYREHIGAVERFVARRAGDRELAADLTADVFLAAIESAATYETSRGAPVAWLLDLDDMARIDDRIAAEKQSRRLYRAMDRLPEGERAVLELVAVDELSLAEAAAALRIRPVTARVRFHRARRRMADQLRGSVADELSPWLSRAKETAS